MADAGFRQRLLVRLCERRVAITIAFVLSGVMFAVATVLFLAADLSRASRVIALVDAGISGVVLVGSAAVLRRCNRFQRAE